MGSIHILQFCIRRIFIIKCVKNFVSKEYAYIESRSLYVKVLSLRFSFKLGRVNQIFKKKINFVKRNQQISVFILSVNTSTIRIYGATKIFMLDDKFESTFIDN